MNADLLPLGTCPAHPEAARKPMDSGAGEAIIGGSSGVRALPSRPGEALADKAAVRIAIHQLTDGELEHEAQVMAKDVARRQSTLHQIRMEMRRRKRAAR